MTPWPALDGFDLAHGSHAVCLKPSLRAAAQLERLHDGFPALFRKVAEFDTATVAAIITLAATDPREARAYLQATRNAPLGATLIPAQAPVMALCEALIPVPAEDGATPDRDAKPMSWPDAFKQLYGFATGWLGWTPAEAWSASPQEITDAFTAHADKLKALHGEADKDELTGPSAAQRQDNIAQGLDPEFDRASLTDLKLALMGNG